MKMLFKIKDKNLYPVCKIYYGEYEHCRDNYIGETVRNTVNTLKEILIMYSIGRFYA